MALNVSLNPSPTIWYRLMLSLLCFGAQGSVKLDRGTTHLLRRSDVEHLVRQGLLQELENEST